MPRSRRTYQAKRPIESYDHRDKERLNNPPVGLVTPETDRDGGRKTYAYDPHLDPQLQWAGKAEHTSFEVPTVSLHVHERIDPRTIVEATRKRNGNGAPIQGSLFELPEENPPVRSAIEFYQHRHNWSNRLVAGDSLLVMNSLLEKEGMAGKVQMVYIDPPYGIRYGSNFQPFVDKRDVKDGNDEDLTQEPETIKAFRDTWELGIHSYLSYLRDRLLLAREMLADSGSCFVQISDENLHHVRELMDEAFGQRNFVSVISIRKTTSQGTAVLLGTTTDFIVWYARDRNAVKYRQIFASRSDAADERYDQALLTDGSVVPAGTLDDTQGGDGWVFRVDNLTSSRPAGDGDVREFEFRGRKYTPGRGTFKTNLDGLVRLANAERLHATAGATLNYRRFKSDFPIAAIGNLWNDISGAVQSRSDPKVYVVQSSTEVIERCILMTTDPGDLVFDPTCGSGTTAYVAEQWGRRWITCDTSRVSITLAKQRLMTALFDYYKLAHPDEGVGSGFTYKTVPHVTLGSIANNPDIKEGMSQAQIDAAIARHAPQETLYDQPAVDTGKRRVTGPFSVEAVPAPAVKPIDDAAEPASMPADDTVARSGETLRQSDWRDELLRTGIRGKAGQFIRFVRLEPLPGCRYLHADGESMPNDAGADSIREGPARASQRVVVSFGPEHAPLEQRQVNQALQEAQTLVPTPRVIVFAAFQFDPEAAKDIDETNWPGITLLKAQMNADLLTEDLKRKRASNESFWLVGQPDVVVDSEEWIVNSKAEALAPYEIVAKLSGVGGLAEINDLGRDYLSVVMAIAQRRDLWDAFATDPGSGFDSGQYSGGSGTSRDRGVPALPGNRTGFPRRIGDTAGFVRQLGTLARSRLDHGIESMRRDRQIADRSGEIAASLSFPLSTIHYSQVAVLGFDYYNTKSGDVESGGQDKIAMWMLDPDYDGRSLYPRQVFFPMAGSNDGWARLARNLRAEIDEELIEAYRGAASLPFEAGENRRIAVKIVDDRGIESLKVVEMDAAQGDATSSERKGRTLEEILEERSKNVPKEEWDRLPGDLIDNLDHYTAGADKEAERPKRSIEEILKDHARQVPPEEWSKLPDDLIERLDHYTSGADL